MIFDDFEAIAKQLKRIQERELRAEKTKQDLDDAADDQLIGNDEDGCSGYDEYRESYVGCDF